jgi:NitT/TauT family transport system substrate-binding protein
MLSRRQLLATAAAAPFATAGPAGCGSSPRRARSAAVDRISYLTGFGSFGREGYAWVADAKGYFREAGIQVTIQPGAAGDTNLKLLAAGKAQFAVIDYSGAMVRAGTGAFADFRCVAAVNQRTTIALMALQGRGIARPGDLLGKTIAQATGAVPKTLFPAYAKLAGFDGAGVRWQDATPQQLPGLLAAGRVDAIGQFVVGVPAVEAAAQGRKAVVLPYSEYLTDLYGNVLVTSTSMIKNNPDLVRRFAGALMKGLRYAVDNPNEAGRILHAAVPATGADIAAAELSLMRPYAGGAAAPGAFEPARVARSTAILQAVGLMPISVPPEQVVDFAALPTHS